MNGILGSTTLLLPSNVYPKRNASPKRHIQQIVITQSTTTFAQAAAHHQNHQHRQHHLNVLNSLEGTPDKKQTGFHLKSLKDQFIDSDPFKKYQRNLKRFQFNQKPIQDLPPDEEFVPAKLIPDIQEPDPDSRPINPATYNYYGSEDFSDEETFNTVENIPVHDVEKVQQQKTTYIQRREYPNIHSEDSDNRPICPGKDTNDSLNYSDDVDSFDGDEHRPKNQEYNRSIQKRKTANNFTGSINQKDQQENTPFYKLEVVPRYSRLTCQNDSSSNHRSTSRRDLTTKTPDNIPLNDSPGLEQVSNLAPCRYCSRKFAKNRLKTHEEICERTLNKQRHKYDAIRHRIKGTDIEAYKFKKGDTSEIRKQGKQDIGRKTSSRFGNTDTPFPRNVTSGSKIKPEQSLSPNRKHSAKVNSNLNSSRSLQEDKSERGKRGDVGRSVVTNRKSFSKFEDESPPNPVKKLELKKAHAGSPIEITKKSSKKAENAQSHRDKFGTRGRANSARQSDLNRKPSATSEDTVKLATNYVPRPKAGAGSRSNITRQSNSLFEDPPVGDKFENRDLNKKGSKSPTRSLPALNRNKRKMEAL